MKKLFLPFVILFIFNSCTSVKITNNRDKTVDFEKFRTYSFYPWDKQNNEVVNEYDKLTILGSIKNEMNKRGYKFVETGGDLIISVFVIVQEETSYQAYTNHYGPGWNYGYAGYYGNGWGVGYYGPVHNNTTITSTSYNKGTLIIDIFNSSDKRQVWQGIASGEVTDNLNRRDRRLPMTIGQVFRRFPVTPKSQKKIEQMHAEQQ
ncbi:MAG: DUF4136 domain-containing protein [Chlorobi bacterium]|nr:DUF4136 domain-containing protein [Chlorobiota bacterium]